MEEQRDDSVVVLSTLPAGRTERRLAAAVGLVSVAVCVALAPFAQVALPLYPAFIPGDQSALVLNDLITAALLFGQFAIARSPALMVLARGYLFTALIAFVHALSFPGAFSETGLMGAGAQTTAWLYMAWHAGFPIAAIGYAWHRRRPGDRARGPILRVILTNAGAVSALVLALTLVATAGEAWLPALLLDNRYTPLLIVTVGAIWSLSLLALVLLMVLAPRPFAVLDLWLMVVLCTWVCDITLSAALNAGRFDLGFYAGRIYALAAASLVLGVLLLETIGLYSRLALSMAAERRERERRLNELQAELVHVSRVSELGQMVSALAHEVNQPLTAIGNYLRASRRLMDGGDPAMLGTALAKAATEATRAGDIIRRLRDFMKKNDSVRRVEELGPLLEETVALALIGADRRNAAVVVRVSPQAGIAMVDKVQIQQVLLNLIRNAVDATADGDPLKLELATASGPPGLVEISVADSGPGLSPAVKERLFQPFNTTKRDGMGVGLSICQSIVQAHGGRIWAEDNPGGGTVFRFTIPDALAEMRQGAVA